MSKRAQIFSLADGDPQTMRFVCGLDGIRLGEGVKRTTVTITRTGVFTDPRYGRFEISREMLLAMVRNFEARTYGQEIFIDVNHEPGKGAAAQVVALSVDGQRLRAEVEFTPYGIEAVQTRGFRYLSAEFVDDYVDNEQGRSHGPVLLGAGLTVRPVIKRLDPVTLSESQSKVPVFLHPELVRQLSESLEHFTMNWLEKLKAKLRALKLSEPTITSICAAYETAAKNLGEDDKAHETLVEQLTAAGKHLAESGTGNGQPVNITIGAPAAPAKKEDDAPKALSEDDVRKLLAEESTKRETDARKLAETQGNRVKLFVDTIGAAKGLSEDTVTTLKKAEKLITADMSEDQVRHLAESQIDLGNQIEAAKKLSNLGFDRPGVVRISLDEGNAIKKLSQDIRGHLRLSADFGAGNLKAVVDEAKLAPFVQKALAEFDRINAPRLHDEAKLLSGGPVNIGDTVLPASYQREVLIEALADLRILDLVSADVEPTDSATHTIPYESRDVSAVHNDGITYEGQAIQLAGVSQANVFAYIEPMKIGLELTDEVMHFSRSNGNINWDAWGRNIASNSRLARELIARRISNRMQRSADAFGSIDVAAEAVDAQVTVGNSLIKLAHFPLIRPYQVRDLQGNAVGSPEHPITIVRNGVACTEYDGTNTQAAGVYFRVENYNLGFIRYVDETGTPVAAADSGVNTISYSYATNVALFDLDNGAVEVPKHLNGLLRAVGAAKATMQTDRFVLPNFGLSSAILNDTITNAEQFVVSLRRDGSNTTAQGDLAEIKAVPCWGTNTVSDLGDERLILGQRGALKYRIAKPFAIGDRYPILNSAGRPLGKWGAYGTEFSSICVPTPLRGYFTSVIAYSATARAAAV